MFPKVYLLPPQV